MAVALTVSEQEAQRLPGHRKQGILLAKSQVDANLALMVIMRAASTGLNKMSGKRFPLW